MPLAPDPLRSISVVTLIAAFIEEAYEERASDIHFDPTPLGTRVRIRTDGLLMDRNLIPPHAHGEVISRIKVLAGLRTDEHQAAQDGRFRHTFPAGEWVDVRVSVMPTYHGENAVLRLLIGAKEAHTLHSLGFSENDEAAIQEALKKPSGLILATGPTGSGKTTTLYTLMRMLAVPGISLVTIEDPIEYAIDGVRQIPVNPRTGLTFATGLRSLLRQDPDVIMVGEIRDEETARMAVNTALTGHLVLSTLHTTSAVGTLARLKDMGVAPYLIASTISLAIGQRLVRRICDACRKDELQESCEACKGSGYHGRISINEVMRVDDALRSAIAADALGNIEELAKAAGMTSIHEDGLQKVAAGETTHEEVLRVTYE